MGDDQRSDQDDGFTADLLREANSSDEPPPDEPQAAAMPRRGDVEDNENTEQGSGRQG